MSHLGMSLKNPGRMDNYRFYNLFRNITEIIKAIFFSQNVPNDFLHKNIADCISFFFFFVKNFINGNFIL